MALRSFKYKPSQVLLQVLIIITGNYNFFNLLTLVLTTALLDDQHLAAEPGLSLPRKMPTCECQAAADSQLSPHLCPLGYLLPSSTL